MVRQRGIKVKLPKMIQSMPKNVQKRSSNYSKPKLGKRKGGGDREREQHEGPALISDASENSFLPSNHHNDSTLVLNPADFQTLVCSESMSEIEGNITELLLGSSRVNSASSFISRPSCNSTHDSHFFPSMDITHVPPTPSSTSGALALSTSLFPTFQDYESDNICKTCKKKFTMRCNLKQHEKIHLGIRDYKCSLCGYASVQKSQLYAHIRQRHTNERPHKCQHENCGYAGATPGMLKSHQLTHRKDDESLKRFSCSFPNCSYKSAYKSSFIQHQKIFHLNIRDFKCQVEDCGASFATSGNLKNHHLTHLKDDESLEEFTCSFPHCSYKSINKYRVTSHQKTGHTDTRDFKCPFRRCEYDTKWNGALKQHIKTKHKNKSPPSHSVSMEVIQEDDEAAPVLNIVTHNEHDEIGIDENPIQEEEVETTLTGQNIQSNFSILRISLNSKGSLVYVVEEICGNSSSFKFWSSTEVREKIPSLVLNFFESNANYWKCPEGCQNKEHENIFSK